MANYNKAKYFKVKKDEIKHEKAKEIVERVGLLEYGTTNQDKLKMWKKREVKYEDISCYAEGQSECYKYGKGRNTKYYYRTPIYTPFTHSIDHYSYGIFNQEPSEKELEVLLMGGESVKYEAQDVAKNVGKKLFKQVFGFNLPSFNISKFFQEEEQQEDIRVTLSNFLGDQVEFGQFVPKQENTREECAAIEDDYKFEYDEKMIENLIDEQDYHQLIKQIDNYQYESQDMVMKF